MMTITSANSIFTLAIAELFGLPQPLQGYAVDEAFDDEALDVSENIMGVDGFMSSGYVPNITKQTITLQADSPSIPLFEYWLGAMKTAREVFRAEGMIVLPGPGKAYVLINGVLQTTKQMPAAKKILQPQSFVIAWESINPAAV